MPSTGGRDGQSQSERGGEDKIPFRSPKLETRSCNLSKLKKEKLFFSLVRFRAMKCVCDFN
jgi:hypothetical protein